MRNQFVIVFIGVFFLVGSCATKKSAATTKKQAVETQSVANFPYIEAFHKAMRLKIQGDTDGAIESLTKCLTIRQDDDAVYYTLGQIYLKKNQFEDAMLMFIKASQIDPKNIWYTEEIAILLYDSKQFDKAAPFFKRMVDYEPKNLSWLYGYGDCLLRSGKVNEALVVLNKAEDILGKNPGLSLEKFKLLMSLKKENDALAELESVLKLYPKDGEVIATLAEYYLKKNNLTKGVEFLEKLVEADSTNGRAHLTLGEIYRANGKVKEGLNEFKKAFRSDDVSDDLKMEVLVNLQKTKQVSSSQVFELIQIMEEQHPESAKTFTVKGDYFMELGEERTALKAYRKALEYEKKQYVIWNQVLFMEYQLGDWETLYLDSKQCLEYFTNVPLVYLMAGLSSNQLDKPDEAIDFLTIGKSIVVKDVELEAEFSGQLGDAYFAKKVFKEGKKHYEEAMKLDAKSNVIKNNYAYRLANAKIDLDLALNLINQAITKSPEQSNYYDTRGWVYFQKGEYQKALTDFEKSNALNENQSIVLEHIGDTYSKLKNSEKAVEYWMKALTITPTNSRIMNKIVTKTYHE